MALLKLPQTTGQSVDTSPSLLSESLALQPAGSLSASFHTGVSPGVILARSIRLGICFLENAGWHTLLSPSGSLGPLTGTGEGQWASS